MTVARLPREAAGPISVSAEPADSGCAPADATHHAHAIGADIAATIAATLKALSDPLRLRMLSAIATDPRGESCVCDLADLAEVSQPTVSHHLKVLRNVGLLESERRGTWVWYSIPTGRRAAATSLLEGFAPAAVNTATPVSGRPDPAELNDLDDRITHLGEDLATEIPGLPATSVMAIVRDSYTALARTATISRYLIPLSEKFARQRIADLSRDRTTGPPQVLFLCVANAGRSQLAAALMTQLSEGRVVARSAGSAPAAEIHPQVRALIAEISAHTDITAYPKPVTDEAVRAADVVVTMGCGDVCPIVPGVRYEEWTVADPALATADEVAAIRDDLAVRVRNLLNSLPNS